MIIRENNLGFILRLMVNFLKNLRIRTKLSLIAVIASAGFIVFGALGYAALNFLMVNGPLYQRIAQGKDIIADVIPPPKYIIESFLILHHMLIEKHPEDMKKLFQDSYRLEKEYAERQDFWMKNLPECSLKNELTMFSHKPALEFFKIRNEEFFPLVRQGQIDKAGELLEVNLEPLYGEHRKHIDRVVEIAKEVNEDNEQYARKIIFKINLHLILIGLVTFAISLVFLVYFIKQITSPLLKLAKAVEEVSSGNFSGEIATDSKDEVGSLAISFERMRLELHKAISGLENEIARRKMAQKATRLLRSTAILISKADSLDSAFAAVLRKICEFTGWVMGEVWFLASDTRRLECGPAWHSRVEGLEKIREASQKITFGVGEGLVGQVWVAQRPLWISDISQATNFLRKQAALASGLKTAIFIPILAESKALAVVDFFTYELEPKDEHLIGLVFATLSELGPVILRKRSERELLRANQELLELDRMKSEFINMASHELRTPIAITREGISQVVEGLRGEIPAQQKRFLSISLNNIDRLVKIVDSIFDVSEIEYSRSELNREATDIAGLAGKVIANFSQQAKNKGLEIKQSFPGKKIELGIDQERIRQVFANLISNAFDFTDQGSIEIKIQEQGTVIECSVSDTGRGIPEGMLPRIFDKFQQSGKGYGPGAKGVGLGLAIAKAIVERHKGKIWVESKPGQGATFTFTLPKENTK